MCNVCSESSRLTKLLGKLQSRKYLRQNLSPCGKGIQHSLEGICYIGETLSPLSSFLPRTAVAFDLSCFLFFSVLKRALVAIVCSVFIEGPFIANMWDFWKYFFLL